MARRVCTAAILKETIAGRPVEEISVSLKIPISDVVKAVSEPKFKRDLLDYRLMRGLQQFETIGNLKACMHAYVNSLKTAMQEDPEFFTQRIKNPKVDVYKELKGMMEVIRVASELTDRELKKMLREAEEQEDPNLAAANKRLKQKNSYRLKQAKELIELKAQVLDEQGLEPIPEEPHVERDNGNSLEPGREGVQKDASPGAGAAVPRDPDFIDDTRRIEQVDEDEPGGAGKAGTHVDSYLLEE